MSQRSVLRPLGLILTDPGLRLPAGLLFLFGIAICVVVPYQSVIGIERFGLSPFAYACVLAGAAVVSVIASVTLGILSDGRFGRRQIAIFSLSVYLTGGLAVTIWPNATAFVFAHVLAYPVGGTIWAQTFALARLSATRHGPAIDGAIMSAVRALYALPFAGALPLLSLALARGMDLTHIYTISFVLTLMMLALVLWAWPKGIEAEWSELRSPLSLRASLRAFTDRALLARVALLGLIGALVGMYMVLIGLTFHAAGRSDGDVAWFVGGVAAAEVPLMLALPLLYPHFRRDQLIAGGAVIYAAHLTLLPFLSGSPLVWLLILPAAVGGAAILTLPIAYAQDLIAGRAGAGSSLMALQRIVADASVAVAFALGTRLAGYGLAAILCAATAVIAALTLMRIDRGRDGTRRHA